MLVEYKKTYLGLETRSADASQAPTLVSFSCPLLPHQGLEPLSLSLGAIMLVVVARHAVYT